MSLPRFRAAIGLGANLGPAQETLQAATEAMGHFPWTAIEAVSPFYRSRPVDAEGPDYLNGVILLQTALGPLELLHALQALETAMGQGEAHRHAPRTIDLDVLWHDTATRDTAELTLPHPRWDQRAFVLEPLSDVLKACPGWGWPLPATQVRQNLAREQGIEQINF